MNLNFLRIAWRDISKIMKNRLIRVSVTAIIIVPLLYSLCYLAAFWDPYSRLKSLPVAVVNNDAGWQKDGSQVNYGDKVVNKLKTNNDLGWHFTNQNNAFTGVKGKKYYAVFVIPKDFSEKILSAKDGKPEKPIIIYTANEKRNFIAAQINNKAALVLKTDIMKDITDEYTKITFDNLYDVKDGFKAASDGSGDLKNALSQAKDGSGKLKDGLGTLDGSIPDLKNGIGQLDTGGKALSDGMGKAKVSVMSVVQSMGNNQGLLSLVNPQNASNMRDILGSSLTLKDADTSLFGMIPSFTNINGGLALFNKTMNDYNSLGISSIMNNPIITALPKIATSQNIANADKLVKDANTLNSIDLNKLAPMQSLLTQAPQLGKLMKEAQGLGSMDMTPINKLSPMLDPNNAKTITGLLGSANSSFSGQNGQNIIDFLNGQVKSAQDYGNNLNSIEQVKNQVNAVVSNSSIPADQKIAALNNLVAAYDRLATATGTNLQNSAPTIGAMKTTLSGFKTALDNNQALIQGVNEGLSDDNVAKADAALGALKTAQTDMNSKDSQNAISAVQSALTPDNIQFISTTLNSLSAMKQDLAANQATLTTMQGLLDSAQGQDIGSKINDMSQKVGNLKADINNAQPVIANIQGLLTQPNIAKLQQAPQLAAQLTSMQKKLKDNQKILEVAQDALSDGNVQMAQNLINSVPTLTGGINQLADGADKLSKGLSQLDSNVPTLADGVDKLSSGSKDLDDGLGKIYDGSNTLNSKLTDGYNKINGNLKNTSSDMGKFVSEPITMKESPINAVKNYGIGFAPYFIPLSLYIGAIMMFFIVTDKVDDDIKAGPKSVVIGKFLSYGYIGIMQAVLASIVVLGLGLRPKHLLFYFIFNIFMSYVFIAIIQCLVFLLGDAGKLLAIVLLILQLTSCAGTFPREVVPKFFRVLYPIMPFTYCDEALREIISGTSYTVIFKDIAVLGAVMVVFVFISTMLKGHADKAKEKLGDINISV